MAASYLVLDQTPTIQVLGPNNVLEVERVEFVTKPSGVYAQRLVPIDAWKAQGSAAWIAPLADAIEGMIAGGLAATATWLQTIDDGTGLLTDAIAFVVVYDPGDGRPIMSAQAVVPVASLTLDTGFGGALASFFGGGASGLDPQQAVRDVYDALVATAHL